MRQHAVPRDRADQPDEDYFDQQPFVASLNAHVWPTSNPRHSAHPQPKSAFSFQASEDVTPRVTEHYLVEEVNGYSPLYTMAEPMVPLEGWDGAYPVIIGMRGISQTTHESVDTFAHVSAVVAIEYALEILSAAREAYRISQVIDQ